MNKRMIIFIGKSLNIIIVLFFFSNFLKANNLKVRLFDHKDKIIYTRVVFENDVAFSYSVKKNKLNNEYEVIIPSKYINNKIIFKDNSKKVNVIRIKTINNKNMFIVKATHDLSILRQFVLKKPFRLVIDLKKTKNKRNIKIFPKKIKITQKIKKNEKPEPVEIKKKKKTDEISIICIDSGHGGENYGAVGKYLKEKDITLKISKELEKLIIKKLKIKVIMIRREDKDVSLNKRAELANNNHADLFISIHVNSSSKREAKGPETFFVSLKATDNESFELAKKENMSFKEIDEKVETDGLKMILWKMAQADYIRDSSRLADYIQRELNILMHTRNRGVKQAPFRVLMRVAMPAVLVEVGFLSNRKEEKMMQKKEFHKKAALSIFKGLRNYIKK